MALDGGITMLQLREKHLCENEFVEEALRVRELCSGYKVPLIINDNVKVALRADADGVHLGSTDMDIAQARRLLGKDKIIGATAKKVDAAKECERLSADYLGAGAIFGSTTKKEAVCISMEELKNIASSVKIPVVAIGGIAMENVDRLEGSRISGIAVVKGIFGQRDIKKSTMELKNRLSKISFGDGSREL